MKHSKNLIKLKSLKEARLRLARQRLQVALGLETIAKRASVDADNAYESKKSEATQIAQSTFMKLTPKQTIENYLSGLNFDHNQLRNEVSVLGNEVLNSRSTEQEAIGKRIEAAKTHLDIEMKTNYFAAYVVGETTRRREAIEDAAEEEVTETLSWVRLR